MIARLLYGKYFPWNKIMFRPSARAEKQKYMKQDFGFNPSVTKHTELAQNEEGLGDGGWGGETLEEARAER